MAKKYNKILTILLSVVLVAALLVGFSGCASGKLQASAERLWHDTKTNKSVETAATVNVKIPLKKKSPNDKSEKATFIKIEGVVTLKRTYIDNELTNAKVVFKKILLKAEGPNIEGLLGSVGNFIPKDSIKNIIASLVSADGLVIEDLIDATLIVKTNELGEPKKMYYDYTIYVTKILNKIGMTVADLDKDFKAKLNGDGNLIPDKNATDALPIENKDGTHFGLDLVKTIMGLFNAGDLRLDKVSLFDLSQAKYTKIKGGNKATIDPYIALKNITDRLYALVEELLSEDKTPFATRIMKVVALVQSKDSEKKVEIEQLKADLSDASSKMVAIMNILNPDANTFEQVVNNVLTLDKKMNTNIVYTKDKKLDTMSSEMAGKIKLSSKQATDIIEYLKNNKEPVKPGDDGGFDILGLLPALLNLLVFETPTSGQTAADIFLNIELGIKWNNSYSY